MKRSISTSVLFLVSAAAVVFFLTHDLQAQNDENPPPEDRRPGRRMREGFLREHPRLADFEEGKKWLEEAKKYQDEIDALAQQLEPVRMEVRELFSQVMEAGTDDERARIRADLKAALEKQDDLEIKMAEKRLEFSEKNFKIALERMIRARVEHEETKRRIHWRTRVIDRRFPGPGPHGGPGRAPWDRPHRDRNEVDE